MNNDIIIYELPFLLNQLDDNNYFKIKTKKIYAQFYNKNYKYDNNKRKSYIKETDAFSDERMIQDIRNVLGKVSEDNKKYVIEILKKNISIVNSNRKNECIQLLVQYACLCLEWNDLYLQIYNEVYYNKTNVDYYQFHKNIYTCIENNIWEYKSYETDEQTIFFRTSNIQLFIKFSMLFPNYCIELCREHQIKSLENWIVFYIKKYIQKIVQSTNSVEKIQSFECLITFYKTFMSLSNNYLKDASKKFKIICNNYKKDIIEPINQIIEDENIPMKLQFKWMEITDLL